MSTIRTNAILDAAGGNTATINGIAPISIAQANAFDIGVGQTWQNVTGSRALATTYTNTTGRPIGVSILCNQTAATGSGAIDLLVGGVAIGRAPTSESTGASWSNLPGTVVAIIPNGATYRVNQTNSTLSTWYELR